MQTSMTASINVQISDILWLNPTIMHANRQNIRLRHLRSEFLWTYASTSAFIPSFERTLPVMHVSAATAVRSFPSYARFTKFRYAFPRISSVFSHHAASTLHILLNVHISLCDLCLREIPLTAKTPSHHRGLSSCLPVACHFMYKPTIGGVSCP